MKNKFYKCALLSLLFQTSCASREISYILRLQFPLTIKNVPPLCGYYKGYRLQFDTDVCVINEPEYTSSYTLVITEAIYPHEKNNKIKFLERDPLRSCRIFYLTYTHLHEWKIQEETAQLALLPKRVLVLLINPDFVKEIRCEKESPDSVICLPTLIIKETITQQELTASIERSWCAAVDTRGIHSPLTFALRKEKNAIITFKKFER